MKGKEVISYAINKVGGALGIDSYEKKLTDFETCGMSPAKGMAVFDSGVKFTMPYYYRVMEDYFINGRKNLFALRFFGSFGLDFGVDAATVVLLFRGNPVGAALLKGGYNFACSVVPDALSSIRKRFGSKEPNTNPAQ